MKTPLGFFLRLVGSIVYGGLLGYAYSPLSMGFWFGIVALILIIVSTDL